MSKSSSKGPFYTDTSPATSISFGGQAARSRYLCISDAGGAVSVWDMKKNLRSRCFRLSSSHKPAATDQQCSQACMDPTDKIVAALSGGVSSNVRLDLFSLREKKATMTPVVTLKDDSDGSNYGGADCFQFSSLITNRIIVGARDGSLLLWDILSASSPSLTTLEKRHTEQVSDLSFSPVNQDLAVSCSMDKTIAFHDINSNKTFQVIRPSVLSRELSLTSLAFNSDGIRLAVGTEHGLVYIYDLRQVGDGPLYTMDVGPEGTASYSVTRLQFASLVVSSSKIQRQVQETQKTHAGNEVEDATPHTAKNSKSFDMNTALTSENEQQSFHNNQLEAKYSAPSPDSPDIVKDLFVNKDMDSLQFSSSQKLKGNSSRSRFSTASQNQLDENKDDTPPQQTSLPINVYSRIIEGTNARNELSAMHYGENSATDNNIPKTIISSESEIQKIVDDSVEALREDIEESIQNLHCDCLRQFQRQSEEMASMFDKQRTDLAQLIRDNIALREENEKLRQGFKAGKSFS